MVKQIDDETLIFDRKAQEAHCLSQLAGLIWRHCDGRATVVDLAALLHRELGVAHDETVVWMALRRLGPTGFTLGMNFRKVPSQIGHVTRSPRYSQDTGGRSGRSYRTFSRERYFRRALVAALVTKPLAALNMPLRQITIGLRLRRQSTASRQTAREDGTELCPITPPRPSRSLPSARTCG